MEEEKEQQEPEFFYPDEFMLSEEGAAAAASQGEGEEGGVEGPPESLEQVELEATLEEVPEQLRVHAKKFGGVSLGWISGLLSIVKRLHMDFNGPARGRQTCI